MADLTITAANVVSGAGAAIEHGTAGATVTAGQIVYLDSTTTGKWQLADADAATAAARGQGKIGVALHGAALNQPLAVQTAGPITIGATVVGGTAYYLSPNPGGIAPLADILTGDYVTLIGIATSTSAIKLDFQYSGVAL
ncbi:hypothetical protein [Sinorhizobium sp. BJ1]|uniref:hypothetical protein n=1 Tax=Sinorhizobium sp. BJ1 TaxID=2035455 RepID=UPI000BE79390|nr:hypothetical protein [Sinorhizobium sp. BJ1]PDT79961.1 hypothetical protein CO676_30405 [Sinorhizobium sp. BJ1]